MQGHADSAQEQVADGQVANVDVADGAEAGVPAVRQQHQQVTTDGEEDHSGHTQHCRHQTLTLQRTRLIGE